jgi:hypothetical protein
MPLGGRFHQIAEEIKQVVADVVAHEFRMELPIVQRLDWVDSRGAIHEHIWQEIAEADLLSCDSTGYIPNVTVECRVCAAVGRNVREIGGLQAEARSLQCACALEKKCSARPLGS